MKPSLRMMLAATSAMLACLAQPAAAEPLDRTALPIRPSLDAKVGRSAADSQPGALAPVRAPAGAPNIVLILMDDVGFSATSTFGGPTPTPTLERLAAHGLRYNNFHTTAICSPTRAALLTGRNHHAVGHGHLVDLAAGYPGYDGRFPASAATIARVLRDNGYSTAFFGKHHNAPGFEAPGAGPFDDWPTRLGFDYFYGFAAGDIDQYSPRLFRGTDQVDDGVETSPDLLDKRLADDAIRWVHNQDAAAADRPFFLYWAPGSTHAPHQAPADWIARFKGKFDQGWDRAREETLARQKAMGVVPKDTRLTPRPAEIPAWDSLSPQLRQVYARQMEVYAAQLAYFDAQVGRFLASSSAWASSTTPSLCSSPATTAPAPRPAPARPPTSWAPWPTASTRPTNSSRPPSPTWAARAPTAATPPAGRTPWTRPSPGSSRSPRTWAGPATAWSSPGRPRSPGTGAPAPASPM